MPTSFLTVSSIQASIATLVITSSLHPSDYLHPCTVQLYTVKVFLLAWDLI